MPLRKLKQNKQNPNKQNKKTHPSSRTKRRRKTITADESCQPHILEDEKGVLSNVREQEMLKPPGRVGVQGERGETNKQRADSHHPLQKGSGVTGTRYL